MTEMRPYDVRVSVERIEGRSEWIGNDDVRIAVGAVTVVDEDGDAARARAAEEVRMYLDAGAGRVEFGTPQGLSTAGGVALLRDRVLPLLR